MTRAELLELARLLKRLDEEIELHTQIEDHDVLLRFRLKDFNIANVNELQLKVETKKLADLN